MKYTIKEIVEKLPPRRSEIRSNDTIEHILTDSRSLSYREHTLFFALHGEVVDGHLYIEQLYEHGVRNFVITTKGEDLIERYPEANFIVVTDTLGYLQRLAKIWRVKFDIPVVGITGSNGKTIVKEFLYQLLHDRYTIVRSPRSYNSQLGVPLSVLEMSSSDTLAIFEAGISKPDEMTNLADIISPTIGILTNIGPAHQENFNSLEEKIDEKLQLFSNCKTIIYNMDDERIEAKMSNEEFANKRIGWSLKNKKADLFIKSIETKEQSTVITFKLLGDNYTIEIPFVDSASVENIIHCIATLITLNSGLIADPSIFQRLEPVEMRLEVKEGNNNNLIINDAYCNDLKSLDIALDFQRRHCKDSNIKRIVILSEIEQSGLLPYELYDEIATKLKRYSIDHVIGIGKNMKHLPANMVVALYDTTEELLKAPIIEELKNSCVLIKGARSFQFERISDRLSRKVHQTTLQVNLGAIVHNLKHYRSRLPKGTKCIGMIKADGYGVGSYEVAKCLDEAHIDTLAVAIADEGKELRKSGILSPIMVMNTEESAFDTLIKYALEPVIFSSSILDKLISKVKKQGFKNIALHLEVDTGMHRLGFMPEELLELADSFKDNNLVYVRSIFTHLAAADAPAQDEFTKKQIEQFEQTAEEFAKKIGYKPLRHILNTAGTERFEEHALDMVRLGIGLYGVSPSGSDQLETVVRLRTTLLQKRFIQAGETVGYGRHGLIQNEGFIGVIPIGYADGYDRRFSQGRGWVSIRNKRCPIIGNVCMDTCMIDLSQCPEAQEGDEVVLFGDDLTDISSLAKAIDTIPYELIADLSPRVRRVYYRE